MLETYLQELKKAKEIFALESDDDDGVYMSDSDDSAFDEADDFMY